MSAVTTMTLKSPERWNVTYESGDAAVHTVRFFYRSPEHRSCHGMYRRICASFAMN